ncbi:MULTISPECIES: alpha-1,4-glucan--maltose-1-phosphate maltosyltransferase [Brevibacterium]|uniref:alpha-1,4-glucan--maltose-1-phosphate maltosyltransferase n=1 Tax=Brevibacterium TaxID=1696 RepID=UPI000DEAAA5C|nr:MULTISPECIES: alpha-1,4-glucan--maltose-1-phosphate maltosyltransferase [Brevibacterium]
MTRTSAAPSPDSRRLHYGRIVITDIEPVVAGGAFPAKATVGEDIPLAATVFREGHDLIGAEAVLLDDAGDEIDRVRLVERTPGTDRFVGVVRPRSTGRFSFVIEAWADPNATWEHAASLKVPAGVDVDLMLAEGLKLLTAAEDLPGRTAEHRTVLAEAIGTLASADLPADQRLAAATSAHVRAAIDAAPLRELVTVSERMPLTVERELAGRAGWYEFFPRSEGARQDEETGRWISGTFRTAARRLPAVAEMGFDVVYLPPIHPIGEVNRKGPNNTLDPGPEDPGSPWAIGSRHGGHDAIHPDLGDFDDFDDFVAQANELGLEVALDLALQAAPDHPWVTSHPEWFTTQLDGTIAYAENPPKKYQDIYPLNFDNDLDGLSREVLRIVELWIDHGVRIFRVDNPHTKPVMFWEWLIASVNERHPDVIFLAEAFTRPPMMHALAQLGFQQSYTYFTWRNTREELEEYLTELRDVSGAFLRPNFFVNTPDILTEYLQFGGPAGFRIRAVLAATASPLWGVYAGYELCEHVPRPGTEEYIDNEKYQYRPRDFAAAEAEGRSLAPYLRRLNAIRKEHPALGDLRNIRLHSADDDSILVYSKRKDDDALIVVINLDPHATRETTVHLDLGELFPAAGAENASETDFEVHDLLSDQTWTWGEHNYVRLDPRVEPAHVLHVRTRP